MAAMMSMTQSLPLTKYRLDMTGASDLSAASDNFRCIADPKQSRFVAAPVNE
jgi:hypothetical protein